MVSQSFNKEVAEMKPVKQEKPLSDTFKLDKRDSFANPDS